MFDLSLDSLESSILMAEQIIKKKELKQKQGKSAGHKLHSSCKKHTSSSRPDKQQQENKSSNSNRLGQTWGKKTTSSSTASTKSSSTSSGAKKNKSRTTNSSNSSNNKNKQILIVPEDQSVISAISDVSSSLNHGSSSVRVTPLLQSIASSGRTSSGGASVSSTSKRSQEQQAAPTALLFQHSMIVDKTWDTIRAMDDYEETLGEQIVLRMMELDPTARTNLKITSLRSMRFDEVCNTLVVIVDLIVSLMGPDIDEFEDELQKLGKQCTSEGIKIELLGTAVSEAMQLVLKNNNSNNGEDKVGDDTIQAWKLVIDFVANKMKSSASLSSS